MNGLVFLLRAIAAPAFMAAAGQAAAQNGTLEEPRGEFEYDLSIGVRYDDTLSVTSIDRVVEDSDYALIASADFDYAFAVTDAAELDFGYSVTSQLFQDFSEFDKLIQIASAGASNDFGPVTAGINYRYIRSDVDNDKLFTTHQFAPFIGGLVRENVYLRGDFFYNDKAFETQPGRDAEEIIVSGDAYFFLDGVRHYAVVGYDYEDSDASEDRFSFTGHEFKIRGVRRFDLGGREARASLEGSLEFRDYDGITPSIGEARDEERGEIELDLEYSLTEIFYLQTTYEHRRFSSNLPALDFNENRIFLGVGIRG